MNIIEIFNIKEFQHEFGSGIYRNLYIAGAGNYGRMLGEYFLQQNITPKNYIDIERKGKLNGIKIRSYDEIANKEDAVFVISSIDWCDSIMNHILDLNCSEGSVIYKIKNVDVIYKLYDLAVNYTDVTKDIKKFKNIHKGERAFVIGNGPSLTIDDLEVLKEHNEITFGHNSIYGIYNLTNWRPTYYNISDANFSNKLREDDLKVITDNSKVLFASAFTNIYNIREKVGLDKVCFYMEFRDPNNASGLFSDDIEKKIYSAGSVVFVSAQIAIYMGITELYFIGCDCNYKKDKNGIDLMAGNHMQEIDDSSEIKDINIEQCIHTYDYYSEEEVMIKEHKAVYKFAKENNIKVYNATRGGKLEVYERIDLNKLYE